MQRRNTDQRSVVLQCIEGLGHATMEQVIKNVHDKDESISVSTIYRNVSVLLSENQLKKFKMNQVEIYETVKDKHYHFMCKECGTIFDLDALSIDKKLTNIKEIDGNQIEDVEIFFSGICKKCLNKRNN